MAQTKLGELQGVSSFQAAPRRGDVDADLLFFSSIDEATRTWLNTLHHMWGLWKKCEGVSKTLTDYYETAPNPYLSTLRILVNTSDFNHIKTRSSLAFTVIEEFSNWIEERKEVYKECLVPDLKIAAFKLVSKQKNMQLIKMVSVVYEFMEHKELFMKMIEKMIEDKKFKEAAQYAALLQLQDCFADPEVLLLPLILQSKLAVVEDFLINCPDIQKSLVIYLDNLIAPGKNMQNTLDQVIHGRNISDVKMSTSHTKPMTKLIARLMKLYNLPPELCPHLNQRRSEGALQFLIHKRYVDGSLSPASWREMAKEAVGDDPKLQLEIVRMLVQANDAQEALYWAQAFNIPKQQWPWAVSYAAEQAAEGVNEGASTSTAENWDAENDTLNYHTLNLSRDCIQIIDNPRAFEEFLDKGLKDVTIVGIDSEWKPSFGTKHTDLALIQIATETNVYILDVTTMGNEMSDLWAELGLTLFANKDILKLGFGIAHDMAVIRDSLPALSKIKTYGRGYLDMLYIWRKLVEEYKFEFPHKGDQNFTSESLSKLVELCLGHRLNKSDQFSNWEQRPLRESQITYAALDAYCLLEIYSVLMSQCSQVDIPFYDICAEVQHIPQKSPKRGTKKPHKQPNTKQYHPVHNERNERHERRNGSHNDNLQKNFQRHGNPQRHPETLRPRHDAQNRHDPQNRHDANMPHRQVQQHQWRNYHAPIPVHKWRVVCDSMLGGLASKLRMCGCDCVHVLFDQGGDQSAKAAMRENRVLLTRNKNYQKFRQYLPFHKCYRVMADTPDKQLREVLNHFGVVVTEKDIFSRCQICNYDEFVKVPKTLMDELVKSFSRITQRNSHHPQPNSFSKSFEGNDEVDYGISDAENHAGDMNTHSGNNEERTWHLRTDTLNVASCTTRYHMRVQIDKVPRDVLKNVPLFYVCERCGKVYWDGTHLERALNGDIKDLIVKE